MRMDKPEQQKADERLAYSRPVLEVYGDLRALTQNKGIPTRPDSTTSRTAGTHAG